MRTIIPERDNPVLREKAQGIPLADIKSKRIQALISDMKALLAKEEFGVALAAPQVGESVRMFVVSGRALARDARNAPDEPLRQAQAKPLRQAQAKPDKKPEPKEILPDQVYVNPVLTKVSRAKTDKHEGCLSIRGKWGEVPRAEKATVEAYDESGRKFTRGASGFLAHIFQHEMDHLEGILYTDKATKLYEESHGK